MTAKNKFDARKLMEKAIEVMEQSMPEGRTDGKKLPLVGAVLVKVDGSQETAHRGELREGDHAEFTLLERKNRANKLDGSVLFATLEPCAPGSRNHPKLSCAERIVNARIKEVWVGIEDPDPTVDRKGIKFLQDHGVVVNMFDRDLQNTIRELNKEFIEQAIERSAAVDELVSEPTLSTLEKPVQASDLKDFSPTALQRYRDHLGAREGIDSLAFQRRLMKQGLLKAAGVRKFTPTGFGMLLFGEHPRDVMPQAGLLATIHFADGTEEVRDFDGPMVSVPEEAIQWLKDKLPNPIDRSAARRSEILGQLYELVREGIVNALVHRNYDLKGSKCQLVITSDTVTIMSPGKPVKPITLEKMQSFDAPMLSRNPILHYVFAKMELAEERGLGLKSMKAYASDTGLPLPTYRWDDPYLVLTLFRSSAAVVSKLPSAIREKLKDDERAALQLIASRESVTTSELMSHMDFDERKAQRVLRKLLDAGLLRRLGRGPATRYEASSL